MEMISSGSLKDISNPSLRAMLTNWVSTLEDISRQEEEQEKQRGYVINLMRVEDKSLRRLFDLANASEDFNLRKSNKTLSNLSLLKSNAFENNILLFYLTSLSTETSHYIPLMQTIDEILESIDTEIEK
jgi:hypothetical protein